MDGMVDHKTIFQSLQNELNARVQARVAINTAHLQAIATFSAGFVVAKATARSGDLGSLRDLAYLLCGLIPMISYYYVSLYMHNDMAIGLLNKCLGYIESLNTELQAKARFYEVGGVYKDTFVARSISNGAVLMLCAVSPFLLLCDVALDAVRTTQNPIAMLFSGGATQLAILVWSFLISGLNIWRLLWLSRYRKRLVDDRGVDEAAMTLGASGSGS